MRRIIIAAAVTVLAGTAACADCLYATGPCSTDSRGNTYRTERSLGGGYTTYRNGVIHSHTDQSPHGGGYQERFIGGGSRDYNYDPFRREEERRYR